HVEAGPSQLFDQAWSASQVDGEPGIKAQFFPRACFPFDDPVADLFGPRRMPDEVIAGKQALPNSEIVQMIEFFDDELRRFVVRPIVVGKNANVAELAKERATARYLENGAVISRDRPVEKLTIHRQRLNGIEALSAFDDFRQDSA